MPAPPESPDESHHQPETAHATPGSTSSIAASVWSSTTAETVVTRHHSPGTDPGDQYRQRETPASPPQDPNKLNSNVVETDLDHDTSSLYRNNADAVLRFDDSAQGSTSKEQASCASFTEWSLNLFGITGGKWKRALFLHLIIALLFNSYSIALATYSAFWAEKPTSADDVVQKLQKVYASRPGSEIALLNQTVTQLIEQRQWEDFSRWIVSCAAYAKQNITGGRCKGALDAFDRLPPYLPTGAARELEKRKPHELAGSVGDATSFSARKGLVLRPRLRPPTKTLAGSCIWFLLLVMFIIFHKEVVQFVLSVWSRSLLRRHKIRKLEDKEVKGPVEDIEPVLVRSSAVSPPGRGRVRNRKKTSRAAADIWTAASMGDAGAVADRLYWNEHPNIDAMHEDYGTVLQAAAASGQMSVVSIILKRKPDPNVTGGKFHSPLQAAAHANDIKIINALLKRCAMVRAYGGLYGSPLHAAAEMGSFDVVKRLLDVGADPNKKGALSTYPLHAAAFRGNAQMARILLERGADVDAIGERHVTALHAAVIKQHLAVVKVLLEANADVNRVSEASESPLQLACQQRCPELALLLVEHDANISVLDRQVRTPLHYAALVGHEGLVRALLTRDVDSDARDAEGMTALHHAASSGHTRVVQALLEDKVNICAVDKFGAHALLHAASKRHARVLSLLLAAGSPPDASNTFGRTVLHCPADHDDLMIKCLLLRYGADVNALDHHKRTPLHEAVIAGNLTYVTLLLSCEGIQRCPRDAYGVTALDYALDYLGESYGDWQRESTYREIITLLEGPANVNYDLKDRLSARGAVASNVIDLGQKMADGGGSLNVRDKTNTGLLHFAVRTSNRKMLDLLVEAQANFDDPNLQFASALHEAVWIGQTEMVRALLCQRAYGLGPGVTGKDILKTAQESLASEQTREEIKKMLKRHLRRYLPVILEEQSNRPGG